MLRWHSHNAALAEVAAQHLEAFLDHLASKGTRKFPTRGQTGANPSVRWRSGQSWLFHHRSRQMSGYRRDLLHLTMRINWCFRPS
jgi:hypothetical protein